MSGADLGFADRSFLFVICALASAPTMKIGQIQPLELFLLLHFFFLAAKFCLEGFYFRLDLLWRLIGIPNVVFLFFATVFAALSLRLNFYPIASEPSILKQPLFLSLSRLIEYYLVSFYMIYVTDKLLRNRRALLFAVKSYFYMGICSAIYGLLSIPIFLATGFQLGAYGTWDLRVRGFLNEGGPFGLYLVSIGLCGLLLVKFGVFRRSYFATWLVTIILPALFWSRSKAAYTAIFLILCIVLMAERSAWKKVAVVFIIASTVLGFLLQGRLASGFSGYFVSAIDDQVAQMEDLKEEGFGGRAASFVLLPRMIAEHPITGIGFGNYPLMRNDPAYLQGFSAVDHWDLPGSGLISYAAEFGIPLFLALVWILLLPFRYTLKYDAPMLLKVLAAFQPVGLLCGVQLNFFYPWLCSAFALAPLALGAHRSRLLRQQTSEYLSGLPGSI